MKFLILGDLHGYWEDLNITLAKALRDHQDITHIIQVGDFGYGWGGTKPFKASKGFLSNEAMTTYGCADKLWLDGNHENFDKLEMDVGAWQPDWRYMPRGITMQIGWHRAMFFGGASSIDKDRRIPHKEWWPQESITYKQVASTLEIDKTQPIDIIFSHEHPIAFPYGSYKEDFGKADKQALDALREHFKPKFWVFGHHHDYQAGETLGTQWACAPIIEEHKYIIWDGNALELCS